MNEIGKDVRKDTKGGIKEKRINERIKRRQTNEEQKGKKGEMREIEKEDEK